MAPAPLKYVLLELLPQDRIAVATLCEADHSVLCDFTSDCCPNCAIQGCLQLAAHDGMIVQDEKIQIRHINLNE